MAKRFLKSENETVIEIAGLHVLTDCSPVTLREIQRVRSFLLLSLFVYTDQVTHISCHHFADGETEAQSILETFPS